MLNPSLTKDWRLGSSKLLLFMVLHLVSDMIFDYFNLVSIKINIYPC